MTRANNLFSKCRLHFTSATEAKLLSALAASATASSLSLKSSGSKEPTISSGGSLRTCGKVTGALRSRCKDFQGRVRAYGLG